MRRWGLAAMGIGVVVMLFSLPAWSADDAWKLIKEDDGVCLYEKNVENSDYDAFKATTVVNATMAAVGAVLRDIPAYPRWMARISEASVLKKYDANNMDVHLIMDFPWPTTDREAFIKGETAVDPATGNVTVTTRVMDKAPGRNPKLVRVPRLVQKFSLIYRDFYTTEVSFSLHLEAGGNLPVFTVNPATQEVPYQSLKNLRKFVAKEPYRSADPLQPVNIMITKTIITAILGNYIQDPAIIAMATSDSDIMNVAIRSSYSKEGLRKTTVAIVKKYVQSPLYTEKIQGLKHKDLLVSLVRDEALLHRMLAEESLVDLVLETGGMTDRVVAAIVDYIKDRQE